MTTANAGRPDGAPEASAGGPPVPGTDTVTGDDLVVVVPSPCWPLAFRPQSRTVPSAIRARVE